MTSRREETDSSKRWNDDFDKGAEAALRRAAKKVQEHSRRTGTPLVYMEDGKVVTKVFGEDEG